MESVPAGINKCALHNAWIKKSGEKRNNTLFRFCPICLALEQKKQQQTVEDNGAPPAVKPRILTL